MKTFGFLTGALAVTALAGLTPGVTLADAAQAKATAAQHAGLAAGQGDIGAVQRHLHHTLNCLVGPEGEGFDQAAGNPCAQAGGAIPQTTDAEMKGELEQVAAQVRETLAGGELAAAQAGATAIQKALAD